MILFFSLNALGQDKLGKKNNPETVKNDQFVQKIQIDTSKCSFILLPDDGLITTERGYAVTEYILVDDKPIALNRMYYTEKWQVIKKEDVLNLYLKKWK